MNTLYLVSIKSDDDLSGMLEGKGKDCGEAPGVWHFDRVLRGEGLRVGH